jgi:hypothetical protein
MKFWKSCVLGVLVLCFSLSVAACGFLANDSNAYITIKEKSAFSEPTGTPKTPDKPDKPENKENEITEIIDSQNTANITENTEQPAPPTKTHARRKHHRREPKQTFSVTIHQGAQSGTFYTENWAVYTGGEYSPNEIITVFVDPCSKNKFVNLAYSTDNFVSQFTVVQLVEINEEGCLKFQFQMPNANICLCAF